MTLRSFYIGGLVSVLLLAAIVFAGQRIVHADELEVQGPGLPTECSDLIDNDNDGVTDFVPLFGDPDCENIFDSSESGSEGGEGDFPLNQCLDGIDNDNDGLIDLADAGCINAGDNDESNGGGGGENPTDVCPNIDGVQTEVPLGKVLQDGNCVDTPTGGGGGSSDVCPNIDGTQSEVPEGKVLQDGNCVDAPVSGGGGGGGGGGGSVLGTTTPASCDTYITSFMRMGQINNVDQVKRMQGILKNFEGADLEESGEYDEKSAAAIRAFQLKYSSEILTPWGIEEPTGYVFLTTKKKLNEVYCKNTKAFPLTVDEVEHIEKSKNPVRPVASLTPITPKKAVQPSLAPKADLKTGTTTIDASDDEENVTGNRFSNFFRRIFDRFR